MIDDKPKSHVDPDAEFERNWERIVAEKGLDVTAPIIRPYAELFFRLGCQVGIRQIVAIGTLNGVFDSEFQERVEEFKR